MPRRTIHFPGRLIREEELRITCDEPGLHRVRDFVLRMCQEAHFTPHEAHNLRLAVDEAASNVLRHAYKGVPGPLSLKAAVYASYLRVELADKGTSFAWSRARTPDLNQYVSQRKRGGLGIWFIRKLTDASDYRVLRDGNHLILWKRVPAARVPLGTKLRQWLIQKQSLRVVFIRRMALLLGVVISLVFGYGAYQVRQSLRSRFIYTAESTVQDMAAASLDRLYKREDLMLSSLVTDVLKHDPALGYAVVVDSKGVILGSGDLNQLFTPYQPPPGVGPAGPRVEKKTWVDPRGEKFYDVSIAIMDHGRAFGQVHVGLKESAIRLAVQREQEGLILMGLFFLLMGLGGSWFLIKVIISPIQLLTDGVVAIGEGRLEHRIQLSTNDEFGQIASAFNQMAQKFSSAQKSLIEQEAMKKELQVAKVIQQTLLPRELPQVEGYDVSSLYRAAKDVGGDYYDFIRVDRKRFGICVADVSGKGVPGSLVMTMIRTSLRLEARGNPSPSRVLDQVNSFVTDDMKRGMFVTLFYLVLDSHKRLIQFASAGHDPLILYRAATRKTYMLKPRGFPLGISLPDPALFGKSLGEEQVHLAKGDILVAYTDGIAEAMNEKRELYGLERFIRFIRLNAGLTSKEFVDKLDQEIHAFTGDYPQNDDITLVAIKEGLSEQEMQDGLRHKLVDLVENRRLSIAEACRRLNLTPSAWYSYQRRKAKLGAEGALRTRRLRKEELKQVSLEERELLYPLIARNPEWESKELAREINRDQPAESRIEGEAVDHELARLKLVTLEQRQKFAARWARGGAAAALPALEARRLVAANGGAPAPLPAPGGEPEAPPRELPALPPPAQGGAPVEEAAAPAPEGAAAETPAENGNTEGER